MMRRVALVLLVMIPSSQLCAYTNSTNQNSTGCVPILHKMVDQLAKSNELIADLVPKFLEDLKTLNQKIAETTTLVEERTSTGYIVSIFAASVASVLAIGIPMVFGAKLVYKKCCLSKVRQVATDGVALGN